MRPSREEIVSAYLDAMTAAEKDDLLWHYIMFDEEEVSTTKMENKILSLACEDALDNIAAVARVDGVREGTFE